MSEEEFFIPSFEAIKEINPSFDFMDNKVFVGFLIPARSMESQRLEPFWLCEVGLVDRNYLKDNDIGIKKGKMYKNIRISVGLLKEFYELNNKDIDLTPVMNDLNDVSSPLRDKILENLSQILKNYLPSSYHSYQFINNNVNFVNKEFIKTLLRDIFNSINSKLGYYLNIDMNDMKLVSLWSIGTYFYPLFDAYAYLYITGIKRSGKTSLLKILNQVCFNALSTVTMTAASAFRIISSMRPTLLIDETDMFAKELKSELRTILLAAYKAGSTVIRAEQATQSIKSFEPAVYEDIYCPIAMVNITGMEDVLEDRTITVIMQRAIGKVYDDRTLRIGDDPDWQNIRDSLYLALLFGWRYIKQCYRSKTNTTVLENRDWEILKPILILAEIVMSDEELQQFILYLKKKCEEKKTEDLATRREAVIVAALLKLVKEERWYRFAEDIKAVIIAELDTDELPDWISPSIIGRVMRRLGFTNKRIYAGRKLEYWLTPKEVRAVADRLGLTEPEQQLDNWIIEQLKVQHMSYAELEQAFMRANNISDPTDERLDELHRAFELLKEQNKIVTHQVVPKGELYGL